MEEFMKLYQKCQTLASKVYGNYMRKTYKYVNSVIFQKLQMQKRK